MSCKTRNIWSKVARKGGIVCPMTKKGWEHMFLIFQQISDNNLAVQKLNTTEYKMLVTRN